MARTPAQRFWEKVDKSGVQPEVYPGIGRCWLWTATRVPGGYGRFRVGGRGPEGLSLAHRFSWVIRHGDPGELLVLHRCDVPNCVNPDHLFLGTRDDNTADMLRKGRNKHAKVPRVGPPSIPQTRPFDHTDRVRVHGFTAKERSQIHREIDSILAMSSRTRLVPIAVCPRIPIYDEVSVAFPEPEEDTADVG
jgi:hypothetical protein